MATRKDEDYVGDHDDDRGDEEPLLEPTPAPGRISSSDVTGGSAAPRMARFGEGGEGKAARRERNVKGSREGFFSRIGTFWRDVRSELRRVTWPTARDVQNTTIITIVAVAFFAAYLWAIDQAFAKMLGGLTKLLGG